MGGIGLPVHLRNQKEFNRLTFKKRYPTQEEQRIATRVSYLEKKVAGLEKMIIRTRADMFLNRR